MVNPVPQTPEVLYIIKSMHNNAADDATLCVIGRDPTSTIDIHMHHTQTLPRWQRAMSRP